MFFLGGGGVGAFCSVVMHGDEPAVTYLDLIRNLKSLTLVTLVDIYRALSAYRRYFRYLLE